MLLLIKRRYPSLICHICFRPIYQQPITMYLTFKSDKQPPTQKSPNPDVLDTADIQTVPALQLLQQPVFQRQQRLCQHRHLVHLYSECRFE